MDRAADLSSEFAMLVHDNERRWRVSPKRVMKLGTELAKQGAQSKPQS
jgi:hypothetical protein